jgi:hypothetical protein
LKPHALDALVKLKTFVAAADRPVAPEDTALVQRPGSPRPEAMDRREFEAQWDGRLVLMARRVGLLDLSRRFDITWLLQLLSRARLQAKMLGAAHHFRDANSRRSVGSAPALRRPHESEAAPQG